MKNFLNFSQRQGEKVPKFVKKGNSRLPEAPFPDQKSQEHPEEVPHAQVSPADAEGGADPAGRHNQTHGSLRQQGEPPVEGPQEVQQRPQDGPRQEAPQEPSPDDFGTHRQSPRLGLASS